VPGASRQDNSAGEPNGDGRRLGGEPPVVVARARRRHPDRQPRHEWTAAPADTSGLDTAAGRGHPGCLTVYSIGCARGANGEASVGDRPTNIPRHAGDGRHP